MSLSLMIFPMLRGSISDGLSNLVGSGVLALTALITLRGYGNYEPEEIYFREKHCSAYQK